MPKIEAIITEKNKHEKKTMKYLNDRLVGSMLIINSVDWELNAEIQKKYIITEIKERKRLKPKEELAKPDKRFRNTKNDEYKIHCYDINNNVKKIFGWSIHSMNKLLAERDPNKEHFNKIELI